MVLLGSIVDASAVAIGALLGVLVKKLIPERMEDTLMKGLGFFTIFLGICSIGSESNVVMVVVSLVVGAFIGGGLKLQDRIEGLGNRFNGGSDASGSKLVNGFITAVLMFCVGAMPIIGGIRSGMYADHSYLYSKAIMDGIVAALFASTMGIGVMFSAIVVLIVEGSITLLAEVLTPYLMASRAEIDSLGAIMMLMMGANISRITKVKIMDFLPAIPIVVILMSVFGGV